MKKKTKETKLNYNFVFKVRGNTPYPYALKRSIETFLKDTVIPLFPNLLNRNEEATVELEIIELDKKKK